MAPSWDPHNELNVKYMLFSIPKITKCYFEDGYLDTNVYLWEELPCDHNIPGPAIIIDKNRCIFVMLYHLVSGRDKATLDYLQIIIL